MAVSAAGVCDTADRSDGGKYEQLIEQAAPGVPPPLPVGKRQAVYQIRHEGTVVLVAESHTAPPGPAVIEFALEGPLSG